MSGAELAKSERELAVLLTYLAVALLLIRNYSCNVRDLNYLDLILTVWIFSLCKDKRMDFM